MEFPLSLTDSERRGTPRRRASFLILSRAVVLLCFVVFAGSLLLAPLRILDEEDLGCICRSGWFFWFDWVGGLLLCGFHVLAGVPSAPRVVAVKLLGGVPPALRVAAVHVFSGVPSAFRVVPVHILAQIPLVLRAIAVHLLSSFLLRFSANVILCSGLLQLTCLDSPHHIKRMLSRHCEIQSWTSFSGLGAGTGVVSSSWI